jgi:hypothetical protein
MGNHFPASCALVLSFIAPCANVWACEDEHPPIVSTPAEKLVLHGVDGDQVLGLTFDPRGVGAITPAGDNARQWIDTTDPTGVWHYREWQWWKDHPWGESCRPRFYSDVKFRALRDARRGAEISYQIDGFDCRQSFFVPDAIDSDAPHWDLVTTIRNDSGREAEEYGQFFACYTPLNRGRSFWFWDESSELVRFADRGVGHLDGFIAHPQAYFLDEGAIPHCPRGGGKIVGRWRQPLMVSQASHAGWRSVIMIEPQYAGALAQGIHGVAMDYILFPGPDQRACANGAEFSAHIRHVMLKSPELPAAEPLHELWNEFQRSHDEIRELTSRR